MTEEVIDKNVLRIWYKSERNNVNYVFNKIMTYLDKRDIFLIITKKKFYDLFVELLFKFNKSRYIVNHHNNNWIF